MSRDERILWIRDGLVAWGDKRSVEALDSLVAAFRSAQAEAAALRVDRDECLRLLSEERRAKDHAETEAAVLRARLEKAREALAAYMKPGPSLGEPGGVAAAEAAGSALRDLRAALERKEGE